MDKVMILRSDTHITFKTKNKIVRLKFEDIEEVKVEYNKLTITTITKSFSLNGVEFDDLCDVIPELAMHCEIK